MSYIASLGGSRDPPGFATEHESDLEIVLKRQFFEVFKVKK